MGFEAFELKDFGLKGLRATAYGLRSLRA